MAEVLGTIASGLQVAALAGKIISIGLQIRTVYHEIQDASEEVTLRLQELEALSETLQDSKSVSSKVRRFCERCLCELYLVLGDLEGHIQKSKGIRRMVASTKVILKKDTIRKLESRLDRSVQLLGLANQCLMASRLSLMLDKQDAMKTLFMAYVSQPRVIETSFSTQPVESICVEPRAIEDMSRELTPWDEDSRGETLFSFSVFRGRWDVCNYLLDVGAGHHLDKSFKDGTNRVVWSYEKWGRSLYVGRRFRPCAEMVHECQKVIGRLEDDSLIVSLLSGYTGFFDEFCALRRFAWPDSSFYHPDFALHRMQFAVFIACALNNGWAAPAMIRSVLGLDNGIAQGNLDFSVRTIFGETIFHGLAMKAYWQKPGDVHYKSGYRNVQQRSQLLYCRDARNSFTPGSMTSMRLELTC
ncbi:hypothetical protein J7T55_007964 [Diaporthe amygdali]|uniref:uncharacterized protein n=1 Tax=Phomopsis amygdali TaxID=1214568 RepID=UPI0022FF0F7E|nr:uncharacterized protein J7T55_007964 [Diaporthe amygdali]KAJ0114130.1 hypothetical protein J7T55_007964 [Diaporthe amygdali]